MLTRIDQSRRSSNKSRIRVIQCTLCPHVDASRFGNMTLPEVEIWFWNMALPEVEICIASRVDSFHFYSHNKKANGSHDRQTRVTA